MAKNGEASFLLKFKETGKEVLDKTAKALDDIKGKAALVSAAVTGFIGASIAAYKGDEAALNELNAAIRAQGLDVDKLSARYVDLTSAIQKKTTVDDSEIQMGIARAQQMTGQLELTDDLIKATVDFATATKMDMASAFDVVGKSIGTSRNMLSRYGIELDETATATEKMDAVTLALTARYNGFAESQAEGLGVLERVKNEFGDLLGTIGKQFAPAVTKAGNAVADLLIYLQNDSFGQFIAVSAAIAAGVAGFVAALGSAIAILPALSAGIAAVGTAFTILTGPIGLVSAAVAALVAAWQFDFMDVQEVTFGVFGAVKTFLSNFVTNTTALFSNFGSLLKSAFSLDLDGIKTSFNEIQNVAKKAADETVSAFKKSYKDREAALAASVDNSVKKEDQGAKEIAAQQAALKDQVKAYQDEILAKKEAAKEAEKAQVEEVKEQKRQAAEDEKSHIDMLTGYANAAVSGGFQGVSSKLLGDFADSFIPGIGGAVSQMFNMLSQDSDAFTKQITQLFSAEFLPNIVANIPIMFSALAEALPEFIDELIKAIIVATPQIAIALAKSFGDVNFYKALVKAIWEGFKQGIIEALKAVRDAIAEAFTIKLPGTGKGGVVDSVSSGLKSIGSALGFNEGGLVPIQKFAAGGTVDTVPAMLTPGEFVMNKDATTRNFDLLNRLNNGGPSHGGGVTINLTVNGGLLGDEQSARQLAKAIDQQLLNLRRGNESLAFDRGIV